MSNKKVQQNSSPIKGLKESFAKQGEIIINNDSIKIPKTQGEATKITTYSVVTDSKDT